MICRICLRFLISFSVGAALLLSASACGKMGTDQSTSVSAALATMVSTPAKIETPDLPPGFTPTPLSSPDPNQPFGYMENVTIAPGQMPTPESIVKSWGLVIVGRVVEIRPSEWTTPDKKRPVNPFESVPRDENTIITPVVIELEGVPITSRYSNTTSNKQVVVALFGGVVGRDEVKSNDPRYGAFEVGQRVLLGLSDKSFERNTIANGDAPYQTAAGPAWTVGIRYLLTEDGKAVPANPFGETQNSADFISSIRSAAQSP